MSRKNIFFFVLVFIVLIFGFLVFQKRPRLDEKELKVIPPKEIIMELKLTSPTFENNSQIPEKYTCDGENINPPLKIEGITEEAKSSALIIDDPDAPMGTFTHWLVWNIPPQTKEVLENSLPEEAIQGKNDFGKIEYGGPCPPFGTHRYFFKLYALDIQLDLKPGASKKELEKAMAGHIISQASLVGLYQR